MIAYLRGTLLETGPLMAVIEASGVGYEVNLPLSTTERLPRPGVETALFIHAVYREDAQSLYGFLQRRERDFFRVLVSRVSGVGPRLALALMSHLSLPTLEEAISTGNAAMLAKCPGIGKKTAERLIVELRDKLGGSATGTAVLSSPPAGEAGAAADETGAERTSQALWSDARTALTTLGYSLAEADKAVGRALESIRKRDSDSSVGVEAIVREALRNR